MIGVDKVEDIRRRARRGESVSGIAAATGVSGPTVRKYIAAGDLSPRPPATRGGTSSPMMEPYAETVEGWLREDLRVWRKQRHTARRIHDRLVEEEGFQGSYETVGNFVRAARERIARERGEREAQGYLVLDWRPGECQVDFGQADFRVRGTLRRGHYLVVEFPHSNVGLAQVFWGETAECVCHGLRAAFEFAGGVPSRAVFDNATEVGRRVGSKVVTSALFRAFAAHYGLDYSFTNPYSGNEKGSVENKVGALRRNLFVPVPSFHDVEAFNRRLLERVRGRLGGEAALQEGGRGVRALRGGPRRDVPAAGRALLLRGVGDEEVRRPGLLQGGRRPPLLRRAGARRRRGRGRDGRVRGDGGGPRRGGRRDLREDVGRRADLLHGPAGAAGAAVPEVGGLAGQRRALRAARGARRVPRLRGPGGPARGPARAARLRRARRAARGRGGGVEGAGGDRRRGRRVPRALRRRRRVGRRQDRVRRAGRPVRIRPGPRARGGGAAPMPRIAEADRLEFAARARSLFISGATVEWFLESATPGQLEACSSMLARELESRERSKRARLLRQARFPVHKTLEGFDWSNVGFPDGWGRDEMLSLGFAAAAEDLVLHGPTGRGKTHVATALGIEATARGIPVRFYQTASLVLQLGKAKREGTLDRLMAEIGRCGLVVLDEFGYVPFDVDGARLLYQVIADSYERRSIVFTTNIEFSRWGTVFADDKLAAAIVDRVVHHGRLVEFGGPSHRLEHALMLGKGGRA